MDLADFAPLTGWGDIDYTCPHCGELLLHRLVDGAKVPVAVFRCHKCRNYSHMDAVMTTRRAEDTNEATLSATDERSKQTARQVAVDHAESFGDQMDSEEDLVSGHPADVSQ